ncbi:MAG: Kelch repeat-containing protein [Thalassotalea sp.]
MIKKSITAFIAVSAVVLFTTSCTSITKSADQIATNTNAIAQTPQWQTVPASGPISVRHEAGFINVGEKLYLLGGRRINPVNVYDPATNSWTEKAKPPLEIHHFQPVVFQEKIYIIGAMTGRYPKETPLKNVLIYHPADDIWTTGDEIPADRRRGGSGVSIYNNKIYISGGITQGHMTGTVSWFDQYNPATGEWQVLSDMPNGRDHFQSAVVNNKLYAAGGRTTSAKTKQVFNLVITPVNIYDFDNNQWTSTNTPLPTGRAGNTTVAVNEQVWVIGGESGGQGIAHNDVEIFDIKLNQWQKGAPLVRGRHGTGAVIVDGALWTASGSGNKGGSPELPSLEKILIK